MANFDIVVTDHRPVPGRRFSVNRAHVCAHKRGAVGQGADETFRCSGVKIGRYVLIVQSRREWLTLCEVEVFGKRHHGNICSIAL